ncbi:DUF4336 domain-containing protein [Rubrivivax sp. RP6-9]|uniref:DUF4336 domain-containing protein n=1 Tax=Rubrivivax sp. RP6-9 TaxID=3415750 RepID=UPI003CC5D04C
MPLLPIVAGQIWHARHPVRFGPLRLTTRMTVVRLHNGDLWIHSPIPPSDDLVASLAALGPVRHVVAPNKSHHLFFLAFLQRFPDAAGSIAPGLSAKRPDLAGFAETTVAGPWDADLQGHFIAGLPVLNETAWFHRASGTLILADLLFSFSPANRGLMAVAARALGVHDRLAMSRTMRWAVSDRPAFRASIRPLLDLQVHRVVVAHDQVVEDQAARRLRAAFAGFADPAV